MVLYMLQGICVFPEIQGQEIHVFTELNIPYLSKVTLTWSLLLANF